MKRNAFYAQSGGVTSVINATAASVILEAKKHKEKLSRKGFKAPFIVALDNEKPVPIQEAIKRK